MKAGAEVLEQDAHGIKVLRLPNGDILKTFRVKHLVSSARFYSHARSFCRNADRFRALGIPTVVVKQLFGFADSTNAAVLYQPLAGRTLRQVARTEGLGEPLLQQLGPSSPACTDRAFIFVPCILAISCKPLPANWD